MLSAPVHIGPSTPHTSTPPYFRDLNLDQIVTGILGGKVDHPLTPFYLCPLEDIDAINYRQAVFQDLEQPDVVKVITACVDLTLVNEFDYRTREMREDDRDVNHFYRERFFLNAVEQYCAGVTGLSSGLSTVTLRSDGLGGLRDHLASYVASADFAALQAETGRLQDELDAVSFSLAIKGDRITVGPYDHEADYGAQVGATFTRFRQTPTVDPQRRSRNWDSYAATGILDLVAKVYPDLFAALDRYCADNLNYLDDTVALFDREIYFYLAYLDYIRPLRAAGLTLSYPQMSPTDKAEQLLDTFDLALATQLTTQGEVVVVNDITLSGTERIVVVSGPNNGGKTTLARAFGQVHHLSRLGCPVPGHDVQLLLCDQIFTHFERAENIATLAGKLQDELNRLNTDFQQASPASVFILNEVFNSTTAHDALFLSRQILERVSVLDALGFCVTFLDELSTLNDKTISMVSTVVPGDPSVRTHKVLRIPADGRAYAHAIADKYGLSFDRLVEEIGR